MTRTVADRSPAVVVHLRKPDDDAYRLLGKSVLDAEDGMIARIYSFGIQLLGPFELSQRL